MIRTARPGPNGPAIDLGIKGKKIIRRGAKMQDEYLQALGARLRAVRAGQGLTQRGVENMSGGRWKAVVIGSYERGERAVSVTNLAALAAFYGVQTADLLPEQESAEPVASRSAHMVIDLEKLLQMPRRQAGPLAQYAAAIQSQRGIRQGPTLHINTEDLQSLAVIYNVRMDELIVRLVNLGVLIGTTK